MIVTLQQKPTSWNDADRRISPRMSPVDRKVEATVLLEDGTTRPGTLVDISGQGAAIEGKFHLEEGQRVKLAIALDDDADPHAVEAIIAHQQPRGIGVNFARSPLGAGY